MNVYVSYAVDKQTDVNIAVELAETVLIRIPGPTCAFFPSEAFNIQLESGRHFPKSIEKYVISLNTHAMLAADVVLLIYQPGIESWGVPMELFLANTKGKNVVVLFNEGNPTDMPLYLHAIAAQHKMAFSIDQAADALCEGVKYS